MAGKQGRGSLTTGRGELSATGLGGTLRLSDDPIKSFFLVCCLLLRGLLWLEFRQSAAAGDVMLHFIEGKDRFTPSLDYAQCLVPVET